MNADLARAIADMAQAVRLMARAVPVIEAAAAAATSTPRQTPLVSYVISSDPEPIDDEPVTWEPAALRHATNWLHIALDQHPGMLAAFEEQLARKRQELEDLHGH